MNGDAMMAALNSIVALLEEIDAKLASNGGTSSVEIKTSTRGVDVATKVYAGSAVTSAGDAAVEEFIRVGREIEKRLMGQEA